MRWSIWVGAGILGFIAVIDSAIASTGGQLQGKGLSLLWVLPFVGILLSIALGPLLVPHFWEHHYGKVAAFWGLLVLVPAALIYGAGTSARVLLHTALLEYIPFILLLLALFTVSGGIVIRGNLRGSPALNTGMLAIGAVFASLIGTTGASMVLIRPMLRANDDRPFNAHVFIFFIFLVSNIGGSLTPLGDPPLFLGFLLGVDFFWTTWHLLPMTLVTAAAVLSIFFVIDFVIFRRDGHRPPDPTPPRDLSVTGTLNMLLIGVIILAILFSANFKLGVLEIAGTKLPIENLIRDVTMVIVTLVSVAATPRANREANGFSWAPILEVAKLFAGIFVTIIPVLAILAAGVDGNLAPLVRLATNADGSPDNVAYFWLTGMLSSFLDNAPTYLVFFEMAGGDASHLMTAGAKTLAAISAGAVFMGANSYIGNAPNFMVYAIAKNAGVKMPSFFGYMIWSSLILLPVFVLVTLLFFR